MDSIKQIQVLFIKKRVNFQKVIDLKENSDLSRSDEDICKNIVRVLGDTFIPLQHGGLTLEEFIKDEKAFDLWSKQFTNLLKLSEGGPVLPGNMHPGLLPFMNSMRRLIKPSAFTGKFPV